MFGRISLEHHPKKDAILDAVSKRARHPQKLRSPGLIAKGAAIVAPRFGGRTVYLWVKNKTRVWVDKTNVWISRSVFPRSFTDGTLLQGEMYHDEHVGSDDNQWVIAFEDVLIHEGVVLADTTPFHKRLTILVDLITQLQRCADPAHDPGVFAMKPWVPAPETYDMLLAEKYRKQPTYLIVRFLQKNPGGTTRPDSGLSKDPFFMRIQQDEPSSPQSHSPMGRIFQIRKNVDTADPDQYDLIDPRTRTVEGRACVRTMHCSLWLRSLKSDSKVWCRWMTEYSRYEPYADTGSMVESRAHESHKMDVRGKRGYSGRGTNTRTKSSKPRQKVEILMV